MPGAVSAACACWPTDHLVPLVGVLAGCGVRERVRRAAELKLEQGGGRHLVVRREMLASARGTAQRENAGARLWKGRTHGGEEGRNRRTQTRNEEPVSVHAIPNHPPGHFGLVGAGERSRARGCLSLGPAGMYGIMYQNEKLNSTPVRETAAWVVDGGG